MSQSGVHVVEVHDDNTNSLGQRHARQGNGPDGLGLPRPLLLVRSCEAHDEEKQHRDHRRREPMPQNGSPLQFPGCPESEDCLKEVDREAIPRDALYRSLSIRVHGQAVLVPNLPELDFPNGFEEQTNRAQEHHHAHGDGADLLPHQPSPPCLPQQARCRGLIGVGVEVALALEPEQEHDGGEQMRNCLYAHAPQRHSCVFVSSREGRDQDCTTGEQI
mmetsp:Transcript_31446/g.104271  ORF Transcript_31446/g.104271 Transcript_31446/m.104271 type:complete len:218 (-) Transcript_31446:259-912(-)